MVRQKELEEVADRIINLFETEKNRTKLMEKLILHIMLFTEMEIKEANKLN